MDETSGKGKKQRDRQTCDVAERLGKILDDHKHALRQVVADFFVNSNFSSFCVLEVFIHIGPHGLKASCDLERCNQQLVLNEHLCIRYIFGTFLI